MKPRPFRARAVRLSALEAACERRASLTADTQRRATLEVMAELYISAATLVYIPKLFVSHGGIIKFANGYYGYKRSRA